MSDTFYAVQTHANIGDFIPYLARFLINDLAGFTGPGWTVIDTYSSGATTQHEVPSDSADMDSLAADNGWRTGTLAESDYIILQNNNPDYPFQLGIEYQDQWSIRFILAPLSGFNTSADEADMTSANNWNNPTCSYLDFFGADISAEYNIIADGNRFILYSPYQSGGWTYIGIPEPTSLQAGDNYPAMQYTVTWDIYCTSASLQGLCGSNWARISMFDNTTEVYCYAMSPGTVDFDCSEILYNSTSGLYRFLPLFIGCLTENHEGCFGQLKGVFIGSSALWGSRGTFANNKYAYVNNGFSTDQGSVVFNWDGISSI